MIVFKVVRNQDHSSLPGQHISTICHCPQLCCTCYPSCLRYLQLYANYFQALVPTSLDHLDPIHTRNKRFVYQDISHNKITYFGYSFIGIAIVVLQVIHTSISICKLDSSKGAKAMVCIWLLNLLRSPIYINAILTDG